MHTTVVPCYPPTGHHALSNILTISCRPTSLPSHLPNYQTMATRRALTQPQLHYHLPLFRSPLHTHQPLPPHPHRSCPHTFVPPYFPTLQPCNDPTILLTFLPTFLRPYLRLSLHVYRTRRPRSSRGPTMPSGATLASTGLRRPRWVHVGSRSECTCRNASAGLRRP